MEFRVLGPLEVEGAVGRIDLGGARQRTLLAALLLRRNHVVHRDDLVDAVWGDDPPETATTALQGYVSALRKALGAERIVTRAPGYLLVLEPAATDLGRFEQLAREGRAALAAGGHDEALRLLDEALGLWRGDLLADLDAPFVRAERGRAGELRLEALETRIDAALALGRHVETLPELQALVRAHPLRERLRSQLMLAYYRAGRQAEALDVYRDGRQALHDELGLEPSPALRDLERAILAHDPALGAVDGPVTARSSSRRPRTAIALAALALVAAGAIAAVVAVVSRDDPQVTVPADAIAAVDAGSLTIVGSAPLGGEPTAIATGFGAVWAASADDGRVRRIDPSTLRVTGSVAVGEDPHDLATGFGSVWVAGGSERTLVRIDPSTARVVRTITLDGGAPDDSVFFVAAGRDAVWATLGDRLLRIDPTSGRVTARVRIPWPTGLTATGAEAFVTSDAGLTQVSAAQPVTTRLLARPANAPVVADRAVWMLGTGGIGDVVVYRDDRSALTLDDAVRFPLDLAFGEGAAWVVTADGELLRVDRTLSGVTGRVPVAPTVRSAVAVGFGRVWVSVGEPA